MPPAAGGVRKGGCAVAVSHLTDYFSRVTDPVGDAATIDVVVEAVIRCPPEVVAAYASDPSNAPEWYANISEVEWNTAPPLQVSTEVTFVARFLGRTLRYTYEVVEYTATSLIMRTAEGPFPMATSHRYESTPGGHTQMTLRTEALPAVSRGS